MGANTQQDVYSIADKLRDFIDNKRIKCIIKITSK